AILKCDNCGFTKKKGYWRNAADGRRLCNICGVYECRMGKPRPVGVKYGSESIPKMNKDKRYNMEEEVIHVPSGLPVFLPPNAKEANILTISTSTPTDHIPSSLSSLQKSSYDTDGSLEEIDLL